jgi:hypothetical protein
MAGVLDFQQFVGAADQVKCEQYFPSNRRTLIYNFGRDITGWTFSVDFQTIVVDTVTFQRYTGQPNFSNSRVIGTFAKVEMADFAGGIYVPTIFNAAEGTVRVYHPNDMYTGPIVPDARVNVPITVVSFTWTDVNSPISNVNTHRFALVQCWEPDVVAGDPTLSTNPLYIPLVVA